jgi:hypothetical protein
MTLGGLPNGIASRFALQKRMNGGVSKRTRSRITRLLADVATVSARSTLKSSLFGRRMPLPVVNGLASIDAVEGPRIPFHLGNTPFAS